MSRLAAFLRGINLGKRRVKMAELETKIEGHLEEALGFFTDTFVRTFEGLEETAGHDVVWLRRGGISDSPISTRDFEKAFGGTGSTRRKLGTLRKMLAKFGE